MSENENENLPNTDFTIGGEGNDEGGNSTLPDVDFTIGGESGNETDAGESGNDEGGNSTLPDADFTIGGESGNETDGGDSENETDAGESQNENKVHFTTNRSIKKLNLLWNSVPVFVKWALAYGMIPTTFRLAMTYEEQVLWICNFLEEVVIPSIEKESEAIEELQLAIEELKDYINDLDIPQVVEDEINEMIEDGTFQELFSAYVDPLLEDLQEQIDDLKDTIGNLNLPTTIDPETGEPVEVPMSDVLENNPNRIINPDFFYRFKNMINNSSFEVFDGNTGIPLGWDRWLFFK